jgi:hypothetical protein
MRIKDLFTSSRRYARGSMQAYLEGLKELPWILGVIKNSGVPHSEVTQMMSTLRGYGPEPRWTTLFRQLQPQV